MTRFGLGFIQGPRVVSDQPPPPPPSPADALISAMVPAPSAAREGVIRDTVDALIAAGIWYKLDCLYFLAAHNEQAARLNWIDPDNFTAQLISTPTFTIDIGYLSTTSAALFVAWNPSSDAINMSASSLCGFTRDFTNLALNGASWGTLQVGVAALSFDPRTAGGAFRYRPATASLPADVPNSTSARLLAMDRDGTTLNTYFAGVDTGGETLATGSLPNAANMGLGGAVYSNAGSYSFRNNTRTMVAGWGAHLTAVEHASLNEIIEMYIMRLDADFDNLWNAMTTKPTFARSVNIYNLISSLKANNIWTQLDALYVPAAHDEQAARLNWKNPSQFMAEAVNSPTFTANQGFTATSSPVRGTRVPFDFAANGSQFMQDAAMIFCRLMTNVQTDPIMGTIDVGSPNASVTLSPRTSGNRMSAFINADGGFQTTATTFTEARAVVAAQRNNSSQTAIYRAGSLIETSNITSTGRPTYAYAGLDCRVIDNSGTLQGRDCVNGVCGWGNNLTTTEHGNLSTAVEAYIAGL